MNIFMVLTSVMGLQVNEDWKGLEHFVGTVTSATVAGKLLGIEPGWISTAGRLHLQSIVSQNKKAREEDILEDYELDNLRALQAATSDLLESSGGAESSGAESSGGAASAGGSGDDLAGNLSDEAIANMSAIAN